MEDKLKFNIESLIMEIELTLIPYINGQKFSIDKFQLLRSGNNEALKNKTSSNTTDVSKINERESAKDLAIIMTNDCFFEENIEKTTQSASRLSAWIMRTFHISNSYPMMTIFKSRILSKLDYFSSSHKSIFGKANIENCNDLLLGRLKA